MTACGYVGERAIPHSETHIDSLVFEQYHVLRMRTVHSEYEFLLNVCGATWAGSKGDRWRERSVGRSGRAHPCNSFGSGTDNIARPQQRDMNFRQQRRHAGAFSIQVSVATCEDEVGVPSILFTPLYTFLKQTLVGNRYSPSSFLNRTKTYRLLPSWSNTFDRTSPWDYRPTPSTSKNTSRGSRTKPKPSEGY